MKRIYIAGFYDTRARLRPYRDALNAMGYKVLSTWMDEMETNETYTVAGEGKIMLEARKGDLTYFAVRDITEIKSADLFIIDTLDETPRGGREVEFGIALTRHIPRYMVGPIRNVFHYLAAAHFDTWEELLGFLSPA